MFQFWLLETAFSERMKTPDGTVHLIRVRLLRGIGIMLVVLGIVPRSGRVRQLGGTRFPRGPWVCGDLCLPGRFSRCAMGL